MTGPISYATVASAAVKGSKPVADESVEKIKVDPTLESAANTTPSTAATTTATLGASPPVVSKSSKNNSSLQNSKPQSQIEKLAKSKNGSSSSSSSAGSSAPSTTATTPVEKKAGLTPAPVPSVNVWQKRLSVGDASTAEPKGVVDSVNWPKPRESSAVLDHHSNGKKESGSPSTNSASSTNPPFSGSVKPKKEKWVPYTPVPGPIPSGTDGNKKNQKPRVQHQQQQSGKPNGQPVTAVRVERRNSVGNSNNVVNGNKKKFGQAPLATQLTQTTQSGQGQEPAQAPAAPETDSSSLPVNSLSSEPAANPAQPESLKKPTTPPSGKHDKTSPSQFKDKPRFRPDDPSGYHNHYRHNNMYRRLAQYKNYYMQQDYMYGQPFLPIGPIPANQYEVTLGLIVSQIEYYLSVENLCKDMYLRRQMNSKGFIPLSILAGFNRVRMLTGGDINLLLEACNWAPSAELLNSKIRPRHGWENWVLPLKERDSAGLDEDSNPNTTTEDEAPKLVFDAAAAVPFVPKEPKS